MLNIDNNYELINQLNWRTLIMGSNDHSISKKKKKKKQEHVRLTMSAIFKQAPNL